MIEANTNVQNELSSFEFSYNYVIASSGCVYDLVGYREVINLPNVSFHKSYLQGYRINGFGGLRGFFLSVIFFPCHFSRKWEKIVHTKLANFVYPMMFPHRFSKSDPICFIFFEREGCIYNSSYIAYLRTTYPKCRIVLYLEDLIATISDFDVELLKKKMDLIITYDMNDSKKYGIYYHHTPMSKIKQIAHNNRFQSDVYFCGRAKQRYPEIHRIYQILTKQGFSCDFNVMWLPKGAQKIDGITYRNGNITYEENLQHVVNTKCVLEISQCGASGFTPRLWDSIMYDKHLLTNIPIDETSEFYKKDNIHDVSDVYSGRIKDWIHHESVYPAEMKETLSPLHWLKFIDQNLCKLDTVKNKV